MRCGRDALLRGALILFILFILSKDGGRTGSEGRVASKEGRATRGQEIDEGRARRDEGNLLPSELVTPC
jgi:hypothetical protein